MILADGSVGKHTHELLKLKTLMTSEWMLMASERLPHQVRTHQLSMLILGNRAPSSTGRHMEHDGGGRSAEVDEVDRVREVLCSITASSMAACKGS